MKLINFFVDMDIIYKYFFWVIVGVILYKVHIFCFWVAISIQSILIIHHMIREKTISRLFSLKFKISMLVAVVPIFFLFAMLFYAIHQPWLSQKDLSDLSSFNGVLKYTHKQMRGQHWYLETSDGRHRLEFISSHHRGAKYENETVVIWKIEQWGKNYVYQMESPDGKILIPIDETNENLYLFNITHLFWDLIMLNMLLISIYISPEVNC